MPIENLEEEGLPKNPNLELAQLKFKLSTPKFKNDKNLQKRLMEAIKADSEYSRALIVCCLQLASAHSKVIIHSSCLFSSQDEYSWIQDWINSFFRFLVYYPTCLNFWTPFWYNKYLFAAVMFNWTVRSRCVLSYAALCSSRLFCRFIGTKLHLSYFQMVETDFKLLFGNVCNQ